MRKNCDRVVQAFIGREAERGAASIWTDGTSIYSYRTCIMTREGDGRLVLNLTRYSPTTSNHQNALAKWFNYAVVVEDLPRGCSPDDVSMAQHPKL